MNKGQLRQAYTMFYANEAKQIIEEFDAVKDAINPAEGKFSEGYISYTRGLLVLFSIMLALFFICPLLGIILFIILFCKIIFMPQKYKQEVKQYNQSNKIHSEEEMRTYYDYEYKLKDKLMNKFLSLFGDFKWNKGHSFFNIDNLIILPDMLALDTDDCISGVYEKQNIKFTEVYLGYKGMSKWLFKHISKLTLASKILPIFFIIVFITCALPISEKIKTILFFSYTTFFMIIWGMGFFSPLLMIIFYIMNKKQRGLIIEIDMPKNFEGETVVFEDGMSNKTVDKNKLKNYQKAELEDIEFNKMYSVYTTNQIEARYVLTTSVIERLKSIKFKFEADYMRFIFRNNRITIFVNSSKDLFQMAQRNKKTDLSAFNVMFEEMYSVLSLVEELKLNIRTGL